TGHDRVLGQRAIHFRWMPTMEVNGVRMRTLVQKPHAQPISFGCADGRSGNLTVVDPRRKGDARRDLDVAIDRVDVVLAKQTAIRPRRFAIEAALRIRWKMVEVVAAQVAHRIEARGRHSPDRAELMAVGA